MGSPRVALSTRRSNSAGKFGFLASNVLRPPPGFLARLAAKGTLSRSGVLSVLNSASPRSTLRREIPHTSATALIPPRSRLLASAAAQSLNRRSSSRGRRASNFSFTRSASIMRNTLSQLGHNATVIYARLLSLFNLHEFSIREDSVAVAAPDDSIAGKGRRPRPWRPAMSLTGGIQQ